RGQLIVVTFIGPKETREIENLRIDGGIDFRFAGNHPFQHPLLREAEARFLIVDDGVDGDGGLGEPVSESLLLWRQRIEAAGFNLDEGRLIDAIDERRGGIEGRRSGGECKEKWAHEIDCTAD